MGESEARESGAREKESGVSDRESGARVRGERKWGEREFERVGQERE